MFGRVSVATSCTATSVALSHSPAQWDLSWKEPAVSGSSCVPKLGPRWFPKQEVKNTPCSCRCDWLLRTGVSSFAVDCTQAFGPYFVAVGVSGAVSKQWPVALAVDLTRAACGAAGHANGIVYRWLPKAAVLRCCCLLSPRPHGLPFTFVHALQLQQPQV